MFGRFERQSYEQNRCVFSVDVNILFFPVNFIGFFTWTTLSIHAKWVWLVYAASLHRCLTSEGDGALGMREL